MSNLDDRLKTFFEAAEGPAEALPLPRRRGRTALALAAAAAIVAAAAVAVVVSRHGGGCSHSFWGCGARAFTHCSTRRRWWRRWPGRSTSTRSSATSQPSGTRSPLNCG